MLRPRLVPTLAAALAAAALLGLTGWQLGRHAEKTELAAVITDLHDQPTLHAGLEGQTWRRVRLEGAFTGELMLEAGRPQFGEPGYGVLQGFRTLSGELVLVDRGWIPPGARHGVEELPAASLVEGRLQPLDGEGALPLREAGEPPMWTPGDFAGPHAALNGAVPGLFVVTGPPVEREQSRPRDALPISGYTIVPPWQNSLHYALFWLSLALFVFGMWIQDALSERSGTTTWPAR
ncbi:MAG: SURF1 family protein [Proteobacteria bacterium]|nr:SURF1 family protein [Pseudomonadota bacterium]MCP4916377.1 SURF1 family protein [Pseudomonadota bacterium]